MSFRQNLALHASPIPLRLILAVTFIWAGLGKVLTDMPVQGEQAAILANLGVIQPSEPVPTIPPEAETVDPLPEGSETDPAEEAPAEEGAAEEGAAEDTGPVSLSGPVAASVFTVQNTDRVYTAADFPEPLMVTRLNGLVLLMHASAFPTGIDADGNPLPSIWPAWAGDSAWAVALAWAAAITEIVGGVFILLGLLTRFSALNLAGTMLVAAWLTELGPAIQQGQTVLGIIPDRPAFDIAAWKTLFWQLALLAGAMSVFFTGAGALSLDRMIFEPRKPDPDEDDEDYEDEDDEE